MNLTPEAAEWVRGLVQQEVAKAVAPLRQELDQLDDWANGVFAALSDLLLPLLKGNPEIAAYLEPMWRQAAERYEIAGRVHQADDFHETQALLEARKMLYQTLAMLHVWPTPGASS